MRNDSIREGDAETGIVCLEGNIKKHYNSLYSGWNWRGMIKKINVSEGESERLMERPRLEGKTVFLFLLF